MSFGIDKRAYLPHRQGIYAKGNFEKRNSLPVLGPDVQNITIEQNTFGQGKTHSDSSVFHDLANFDAVSYLRDTTGTQVFSVVLADASTTTPDQMNGVIEPLPIRTVASLTSIDEPFEFRSIKGEFGNGNLDSFRKSDSVESIFSISPPAVKDPYIDSAHLFGDVDAGSVKVPGYFPDDEKIVFPFDDDDDIKTTKKGITASGGDMLVALRAMSPASDSLIDDGFKSAGTGFSYKNSRSGIDSIAFGGLKK